MGSIVHFVGGGTLEVDESPKDVETSLWGLRKVAATLSVGGDQVIVNPAAVAYVIEALPSHGSASVQ